jgi:predicted 2-oxoglutarate/Fe(II)-dependent dioxygenase YbiX
MGEAVIFSCSLLHEAAPVTSVCRFTLLSFFYNDEDAKIRQENQQHIVLKNTEVPVVGDNLINVENESRSKSARGKGFQSKRQ